MLADDFYCSSRVNLGRQSSEFLCPAWSAFSIVENVIVQSYSAAVVDSQFSQLDVGKDAAI